MKLGSSMHLSMDSYADKHIGSYVKCIFTSWVATMSSAMYLNIVKYPPPRKKIINA